MPANPSTHERYQTILKLLKQISERLDAIERDVDQIDRNLRPYGDGTRRTA